MNQSNIVFYPLNQFFSIVYLPICIKNNYSNPFINYPFPNFQISETNNFLSIQNFDQLPFTNVSNFSNFKRPITNINNDVYQNKQIIEPSKKRLRYKQQDKYQLIPMEID